jgi:hypothetical protein
MSTGAHWASLPPGTAAARRENGDSGPFRLKLADPSRISVPLGDNK